MYLNNDEKVSVSAENFVKTIYRFEQGSRLDTRPGTIARQLGITSAAATDMARKLSQRKLIAYEKYKELKLTSEGERMALTLIRKHRLWETFLHRVLELDMHEIHREAEMLEHLTSDFLADKMARFLGNPTCDPHGDPIPDENGAIRSSEALVVLSDTESGQSYRISRLAGSDQEFFDFCRSNDLAIGTAIEVRKLYANTRMVEIEVNGAKLLLAKELTNIIYVSKT